MKKEDQKEIQEFVAVYQSSRCKVCASTGIHLTRRFASFWLVKDKIHESEKILFRIHRLVYFNGSNKDR